MYNLAIGKYTHWYDLAARNTVFELILVGPLDFEYSTPPETNFKGIKISLTGPLGYSYIRHIMKCQIVWLGVQDDPLPLKKE